ncbi:MULTISPECIES: hypothetical protein [Acidithiobacillus]|uniref:hypothetical protein n=1 Tax=Acidithiobacillus ferrivorans TaxID=160808 RepID=UPI001C074148|nr:hypothetical protein [Acidithiobacillus ferrivorans]MBU2850729.1 hypothetical protein [Acidithiobacillus ferrivorans]
MSNHMMDPEQRMAYWLTLQKQRFNPQMAEHQFDELRAALRDALQEMQEEKKQQTTIPFPTSLAAFLTRSFYVLNARGDGLVVIRTGVNYCNSSDGEEVVIMASKESSGMIYFHDDARSIHIMLEDAADTDIERPRISEKLTRMAALHGSHYDPVTHQISVRSQQSTAVDKVHRLIKAAQHIAETNVLDL